MLRSLMQERGIAYYLIPTADFHESEYVGDHFKVREYMTGFTGSAGTAMIGLDDAGLWTDGRYFLQAEGQLAGTGITLYRMGDTGVLSVRDYLREHFPEGGTLGFDGRVVNAKTALEYLKIVQEKGGRLHTDEDLVDTFWEDRPPLPSGRIRVLEEAYTGASATLKLLDLCTVQIGMQTHGIDYHLISSLPDIAWLLNIRGSDIEHVPVVLSYLLIGHGEAYLFADKKKADPLTVEYFAQHNVKLLSYDGITEFLANLPEGTVVQADSRLVNYRLWECMSRCTVHDRPNPSERMKAVKNETEIANTRIAHLKDGIAVTRFMYWLKTNIGRIPMTEYSAGEVLTGLRREQPHFLDLSFENICAYKANAAMMHYAADPEGSSVLEPSGMLLVDSGGHYLEGTTDITRTFILGSISPDERQNFTRTVIANLRLANAQFLYGCTGQNLDILARGEFWKVGLDYKCGTGHGVGHILNVHEGPNAFRYRIPDEHAREGVLEAGMITTVEPGVYVDDCYGIRIENELLCEKRELNNYGLFMGFENLTVCPIDLDGIETAMLTEEDRGYLNAYHASVYEKLSPYFEGEELDWLRHYTREI